MKKSLSYFLPAVVSVVFILIGFTQFSRNNENRIYDLLMRFKPEISENKNILLLDVDDLAISKVGVWPWSRSIMADGLILLKEMGERHTVYLILSIPSRVPGELIQHFLKRNCPSSLMIILQ